MLIEMGFRSPKCMGNSVTYLVGHARGFMKISFETPGIGLVCIFMYFMITKGLLAWSLAPLLPSSNCLVCLMIWRRLYFTRLCRGSLPHELEVKFAEFADLSTLRQLRSPSLPPSIPRHGGWTHSSSVWESLGDELRVVDFSPGVQLG